MLHRFLFVAGMTVGVMTPLVWAAYVSRPASHEARASAVASAKSVEAAPDMPGLAPVPAKHLAAREAVKNVATMDDVTASIRPASMKPAPAEPTRLVAHPKASTPPPGQTYRAYATAFETREPHGATSHGAPK